MRIRKFVVKIEYEVIFKDDLDDNYITQNCVEDQVKYRLPALDYGQNMFWNIDPNSIIINVKEKFSLLDYISKFFK